MNIITANEKKGFLQWLLENHKMKRRESVWIFNYMISHEELLKNIHFVDNAHYCPRAMVISATKSEGVPFRFYRGDNKTVDAEKAFNDMRLNTEEKMFIQVNFPDKYKSVEYAAVHEENAYVPDNTESSLKNKEIAERLIAEHLDQLENETLYKQIDAALDSGDKALFMELTKGLNEKARSY